MTCTTTTISLPPGEDRFLRVFSPFDGAVRNGTEFFCRSSRRHTRIQNSMSVARHFPMDLWPNAGGGTRVNFCANDRVKSVQIDPTGHICGKPSEQVAPWTTGVIVHMFRQPNQVEWIGVVAYGHVKIANGALGAKNTTMGNNGRIQPITLGSVAKNMCTDTTSPCMCSGCGCNDTIPGCPSSTCAACNKTLKDNCCSHDYQCSDFPTHQRCCCCASGAHIHVQADFHSCPAADFQGCGPNLTHNSTPIYTWRCNSQEGCGSNG